MNQADLAARMVTAKTHAERLAVVRGHMGGLGVRVNKRPVVETDVVGNEWDAKGDLVGVPYWSGIGSALGILAFVVALVGLALIVSSRF